MRVYISGPIQGTTDFEDRFTDGVRKILSRGLFPVSPLDVECECEGCPEGVRLPDRDHSWECYLRWDVIALLQCDAVFMLDGWERSHGARFEHHVAVMTGLIVWHESSVPVRRQTNQEEIHATL